MITRWLERLEVSRVGTRVFALLALFASIVIIDALTGLDFTLRALYLLPVSAGAWLLGARAGFVLSIFSVGVSSYFDVSLGLGRERASFVFGDAAVRLAVYLAATVVLVKLHAAQARLGELAETDPLTGVYNRRGFGRIATREIQRSRRTLSYLTIVHFDLDGFKAVNDTLGHSEGDDVLAAVGNALTSSRATDVAARLGGDEFALLLPDTASDSAVTAATRLVSQLSDAMAARAWPITVSVGVATFGVAPRSVEEMLTIADALMYEVKRAGKGGVRYRYIDAGVTVDPIVTSGA